MGHILWIGPRESDVAGLEPVISASTTIFGSNSGNNRSYSKDIGIRVDHNQPDCLPDPYCNEKVAEWIAQYPDLEILYYNSIYSSGLLPRYQERVIGRNDLALLKLLDGKSGARKLAAKYIPIVPYQQVDNITQLRNAVPELSQGTGYILQENHASGGAGTHVIQKDNFEEIVAAFHPEKSYFVSPYIERSVSVNIHCILFDDEIVIFPGSIQLVKVANAKVIYMGADFITYQDLSPAAREDIKRCGEKFCSVLYKMGYRGVLGIDSLLVDQHAYFLEANPRFQASTCLLNKALLDKKLPSIQELHLAAFNGVDGAKFRGLERIQVPYSMAVYTAENWNKHIKCFACLPQAEAADFVPDGYDPLEPVREGAHLFHVIFQTNLCGINPDGALWIYENLYDIEDSFSAAIYARDPLYIKVSLLNQGVQFSQNAKWYLEKHGEIRRAVFSAADITILDGLQVNCPSEVKFVTLSPWRIDLSDAGDLKLYYRNTEISAVAIDMADPYIKQFTKFGIPFQSISFWATDRLRIHHTISCVFKKSDRGCRFCEIPKQDTVCSLADIYEVIDFYLDHADSFRHFLIGGGSEPLDQEACRITKIAKYIRSKSNKPIYLMCLPPKDLSVLKQWYDAGITEIAFNLELFDRVAAKQFMPGKGQIPLNQYLSALEAATSLWGKTGNVRTLFIAGLERTESLLQGIEAVASRGIVPILSIFRALYGTEMGDIVPPSNNWLVSLFYNGEDICRRYHLHLGPSCSACQNNTLSLPFDMLS